MTFPPLSTAGVVLLICAVGLTVTVPIVVLGRLRFARVASEVRRLGQGSTPGPADPLLQAYTLLALVQAAMDIAFVFWFVYTLFVSITSESPTAFLAAMRPLWVWLILGAVRTALEVVIRMIQRPLRDRYAI